MTTRYVGILNNSQMNRFFMTDSIPLNQSWVNVGPPSVTLAHIQRGARQNTVTQYWANAGSES